VLAGFSFRASKAVHLLVQVHLFEFM